MYAGKSTYIKYLISKYTKSKMLIINHKLCHENKIRLHTNELLDAHCIETLNSVNIDPYDVICIDEAQFFDDLHDFVKSIYMMKNKRMYICGVKGDIFDNKFGQILDIIPYASNCKMLKAICTKCNNKAAFTRKPNIINDNTTYIDISDGYYPLCENCI